MDPVWRSRIGNTKGETEGEEGGESDSIDEKVEASKQRFEEMKKNDELRRVRENRRKKKRIAKMRKLNIAASTIQVRRTWLRVRRLESRRKEEQNFDVNQVLESFRTVDSSVLKKERCICKTYT